MGLLQQAQALAPAANWIEAPALGGGVAGEDPDDKKKSPGAL